MSRADQSVLLLGATGTIGRATFAALKAEGHHVVAPTRAQMTGRALTALIKDDACRAVISCIASRSGDAKEAWAVDHGLNSLALKLAVQAGASRFVLLSAICVQKPALAFQHAKLAFEAELRAAPLHWSIVRPTAYFKSLSGQLERLRAGKPFLLFGDGELTACKPISDSDLARYLVDCLSMPERMNRVLPIGGPGPALTPRAQGELLFQALGQEPRFRHVPLGLMTAIIAGLTAVGMVSKTARAKAELARIGRYYASESMLVWDDARGRYDADMTPEFGEQTLGEHYRALVAGEIKDDRGAHSVF